MLITFEGVDACGKTSAIEGLKKHIEQNYNLADFVFTREPGGNSLIAAEKIRELILDNKNEIDSLSEALLYLSSRNIHIEKLIKPALSANKIVICDRFFDSSIAYQGNGRNLGMDKIEKLNLMIVNEVIPEYTFYLKIDAKTSFTRMKNQNRTFDRLESESQKFFEKVIEGYEYLSQRDHDRFIIIDALQTPDKVLADIINIFDKIIITKNRK